VQSHIIVDALHRPGMTIQKGGSAKLPPFSFVPCLAILAGLAALRHKLRSGDFDPPVWEMLR
jgi:hypothetical protein